MYFKAPIAVLLLSAIPALAIPEAADTPIAARFSGADSELPSRFIGRDGCMYKRTCNRKREDNNCLYTRISCDTTKRDAIVDTDCIDKRACDKKVNPDCINKKRACDKKRDEEAAEWAATKRACDAVDPSPDCINLHPPQPPQDKRDEAKVSNCIDKAKRACDKKRDSFDCIDKIKRACDKKRDDNETVESAVKRACDAVGAPDCIDTPPPQEATDETLHAVNCIDKAKRACDKKRDSFDCIDKAKRACDKKRAEEEEPADLVKIACIDKVKRACDSFNGADCANQARDACDKKKRDEEAPADLVKIACIDKVKRACDSANGSNCTVKARDACD